MVYPHVNQTHKKPSETTKRRSPSRTILASLESKRATIVNEVSESKLSPSTLPRVTSNKSPREFQEGEIIRLEFRVKTVESFSSIRVKVEC